MKPTLTFILSLYLCVSMAQGAKHEVWTSSAGTQVEGRYLGSIDSKYWIASQGGQLFRLSERQLSNESLGLISEIDEKMERRRQGHMKPSSLIPEDGNADHDTLITLLCSSKISQLHFESVPLESALATVEGRIDADSIFQVEGEAKNLKINIALRNLYADQMLDYITQQVGTYYRLEEGKIVVRKQ